MALLQGQQLYGDIASDSIPTDKRSDFLLRIAKLAPFARFLQFCPKGPKPRAEQVQWPELDFFPYEVTITVVRNTTDTTITVGTTYIKRVTVGDVLQNPTTRECLLVSTVDTAAGTFVAIRSIGSATGIIAESQVLYCIGNTAGEGQGIPESKTEEPTWTSNYIEHMKKSWKLSGRLDRLGREESLGKGVLYKDQRSMRIQEFLRERELKYFLGQSGVDSTADDGLRRTFMGGAEQFIRAATSRTYNVNAALTTWAQVEAITEQAFDKTDADTLWWFASRRIISQLNQYHMGKVSPDKYHTDKLGTQVTTLETTDGTLKLVKEIWLKGDLAGHGFILDKKCLALSETIPLKIHDDTAPEEDDQKRGYIEWEGTVLYQHADRMLLVYGVAAS